METEIKQEGDTPVSVYNRVRKCLDLRPISWLMTYYNITIRQGREGGEIIVDYTYTEKQKPLISDTLIYEFKKFAEVNGLKYIGGSDKLDEAGRGTFFFEFEL